MQGVPSSINVTGRSPDLKPSKLVPQVAGVFPPSAHTTLQLLPLLTLQTSPPSSACIVRLHCQPASLPHPCAVRQLPSGAQMPLHEIAMPSAPQKQFPTNPMISREHSFPVSSLQFSQYSQLLDLSAHSQLSPTSTCPLPHSTTRHAMSELSALLPHADNTLFESMQGVPSSIQVTARPELNVKRL